MTNVRKLTSWPLVRRATSFVGLMLMLVGVTALMPAANAANAGKTASSGSSGGSDGLVASVVDFAEGSGNQGLTDNRFVGIREASRNYRYLGSYSVKTPKFARRLQVYCADPNDSSAGGYETPTLVSSFRRNDGSGTAGIEKIARVNYVVSMYGGTNNKSQAAAVGAAVYHLLGYSARNLDDENSTAHRDAKAYGVLSLADKYIDEATKYAGNWNLRITVTDAPDTASSTAKVKVRATVESTRTDKMIPNAKVTLDYTGDNRGSKSERTNSRGVAEFEFDAPKNGNYKLRASVVDTPGSSVYQVNPKSSGSQRMFVGGNVRDLKAEINIQMVPPPTQPPGDTPPPIDTWAPEVVTQTSASTVGVGESITDALTITDAPSDYAGTATGKLYGPYLHGHPNATNCLTGDPIAGEVYLPFAGDGEYVSPEVAINGGIGYYTWVWEFPAMSGGTPGVDEWQVDAFTTECGIPEETTRALMVPSLETQISNQSASVGETITDVVTVSGMPSGAGMAINGTWQLHGPIAAGEDGSCLNLDWTTAPLANSGPFQVYDNTWYRVGEHTIETPGCYTYTESLDASDLTIAFPMTDRGIESETTLAKYTPTIATQVSSHNVAPGVTITDDVMVSSTGGAAVPGEWRLLGPIAPKNSMLAGSCLDLDWTNAPEAASGTFTVNGDGTYVVGEHTVAELGCYTYTERLLGTDTTHETDWHEIGIASETTISKATPAVATQISAQSVEVGANLRDTIELTGTHGAGVDLDWRLYGPVAPVDGSCMDLDWDGTRVADQGSMAVTGDGDYRTPATTVDVTGCYTYTARVQANPVVNGVDWHDLGLESETAVVRAAPSLTTQISDKDVKVGDEIHDTITVTDMAGLDATVEWRLLGPVDPADGSCLAADYAAAEIVSEGAFEVAGNGDYGVDETKHTVVEPGCYTYTARVVDGFDVAGVDWHALGLEAETTKATSEVELTTQVSASRVNLGDTVTDQITLKGLHGRSSVGLWELYGPVAPSAEGTCVDLDWATSPLVSDGKFTAEGDGVVSTGEFVADQVGCYTYSAMIEPTDVTTGVDWHDLGLATETFQVVTDPDDPKGVPPVRITSGNPAGMAGGTDSTPFIGAVLLVALVGLGAGAAAARKASA